MHPYRTLAAPDPELAIAATDDGARVAFGVMTVVGGVQVAIGLVHPGPPSVATLFGAACVVSGLAWLLRRGSRLRRRLA